MPVTANSRNAGAAPLITLPERVDQSGDCNGGPMRTKRSGEWVSRTPATKIKDLMSTYLETILATDSVQHAAGRMRAFEIGCLLVRDEEELVGMITDRDIALRVTALGKNAR